MCHWARDAALTRRSLVVLMSHFDVVLRSLERFQYLHWEVGDSHAEIAQCSNQSCSASSNWLPGAVIGFVFFWSIQFQVRKVE